MIRELILAAAALAPFHGIVLSQSDGRHAIVRSAPITKMVASQTRAYAIDPPIGSLKAGTGLDAFLDRSTQPWTLRDAVPAPAFAAGLPVPGRTQPVDFGTLLPRATFIDQDGHMVNLRDAFAGKTALISFIFTRCPDTDVCIAISSKYTQLERALDPKRFALVEISLDPPYDSPAVLRAYGVQFSRDPHIWTLLSGQGLATERVLDAFGISSLQNDDTQNYIHSDKLFIVAPNGRVAYVVDTAGWDPRGVEAEARSVDGMTSNAFERFKLSLIASVVALCGGSQYAGIVMLEVSLFFVITFFVTLGLWLVGRVLWAGSRPS
jgi:cytochrome oxidase Cu insertion factor (SCO1/SenC/PrrC family)